MYVLVTYLIIMFSVLVIFPILTSVGFLVEPLAASDEPPCDSKIYCYGKLLKMVQLARIFPDSKTFVDLPLKYEPSVVLRKFNSMMSAYVENPPREIIIAFVDENFEKNGTELEAWIPDDFHPNPKFLDNIKDPKLRTWASSLHNFWGELGRKINPEVALRPERYSLIYVPNPIIVPGGRFKEFYYWDSYWIQEGLLLSELNKTVKGMIANYVDFVEHNGFVPNGGRVYYQRSQPPMLIPMVKKYLDVTKDLDFLKNIIAKLHTEFQFWVKNRTVTLTVGGKKYMMARYNSMKNGPRPESYYEDYTLASGLKDEQERIEFYHNLHSGAESGWDFSTRWFVHPPYVADELIHGKTSMIVPADLNALLFYNANIMSGFYEQIGDRTQALNYANYAKEFQTAINEVLWDDTLGAWFDYDLVNNKRRNSFYPSNIVPLWAGVHAGNKKIINRVIVYLKNSTALSYISGIPTSLKQSGLQWDFPNGWAPLQSFVVQALDRSGDPAGQEMAFDIANKWLRTNYKGFHQSTPNAMFEKYDITTIGLPGGGGEYDIQIGFGWTNGVVMDFLNRYGDRLNTHEWE